MDKNYSKEQNWEQGNKSFKKHYWCKYAIHNTVLGYIADVLP